jgi:hypothetical protein
VRTRETRGVDSEAKRVRDILRTEKTDVISFWTRTSEHDTGVKRAASKHIEFRVSRGPPLPPFENDNLWDELEG